MILGLVGVRDRDRDFDFLRLALVRFLGLIREGEFDRLRDRWRLVGFVHLFLARRLVALLTGVRDLVALLTRLVLALVLLADLLADLRDLLLVRRRAILLL